MMSASFNFYADADLTSVVDNLLAAFPDTGAAATQRVIWLGSRVSGRRLQVGATITLTGDAAGCLRLARTAQGLTASLPGAPLVILTPVGTPAAIWLSLAASGLPIGAHSAELKLSALEEERM